MSQPDTSESTDTGRPTSAPVRVLPIPPTRTQPPTVPPRPIRPAPTRVDDPRQDASDSVPSTGSCIQSSTHQPIRPHRFAFVSISCPVLCTLCRDYIVTPRCAALQCTHCRALFHGTCGSWITTTTHPYSLEDSPRCERVGVMATAEPLIPLVEHNNNSMQPSAPRLAISLKEQPVHLWNSFQIAHWLTVIGLSRFVMYFLRHEVDGQTLSLLAPFSSQLDQVMDPFTRQALRRAILVLCGEQPCAGEDNSLLESGGLSSDNSQESPTTEISDPVAPTSSTLRRLSLYDNQPELEFEPSTDFFNSHQIRLHSFLQEVACALCAKPLLGLFHQGFQCERCGMIFHRICRALLTEKHTCSGTFPTVTATVPDNIDTLEYSHLPSRLPPYVSDFFAVALEDQPLDAETQLPSFLLACTNAIEHLARDSLSSSTNTTTPSDTAAGATASDSPSRPLDLVRAYQQSASTNTLCELHTQFKHQLPTTTGLSVAGDEEEDATEPCVKLVRLTQLLKAFLRDLPVPVVPELCYSAFCSLATPFKSDAQRKDAVQHFLAQLPTAHRRCLCHVMQHLTFLWLHQRKIHAFTGPGESRAPDAWRANPSCRPISWFLVFRQILIRPPWDRLTELTVSFDTHLRALQTLFIALLPPSEAQASSMLAPVVSRLTLPPILTVAGSTPASVGVEEQLQRHLDLSTSAGGYQTEYGIVDVCTLPPPPCAPDAISGPTIHTPPNPESVTNNAEDLSTREWYWGDVSQAEVRQIMAGLPDGYFLVRAASESSSGAFTLALRLSGENRLLRVYHRGKFFGLSDPPNPLFDSVAKLIEYYQSRSITNGEELKLTPISHRHYGFDRSSGSTISAATTPEGQHHQHPFPSPHAASAMGGTGSTTSVTSVTSSGGGGGGYLSIEQLLAERQRTSQILSECEARIRDLSSEGEQTMQLREEAARMTKGNNKLLEWLNVQRTRLQENMPLAGSRILDQSAMISNSPDLSRQMELTLKRLRETEHNISESNHQFITQSELYRAKLSEQVRAFVNQRKLRRQTQAIKRALKNHGIGSTEDLQSLCSPGENDSVDGRTSSEFGGLPFSVPSSNSGTWKPLRGSRHARSLASFEELAATADEEEDYENTGLAVHNDITDPSTWRLPGLSRDDAERLLIDRPTGTFLIRTAAEGRRWALSVS